MSAGSCLRARARIGVPPTPGAKKEGTGGKKIGISAAAGTVNQICDLLVQISMGLLVQISMGKLPKRPRVGIRRG